LRTFDENLHEHISLDLADGVGRGSDTSSSDQPG